MRKQFCDAMVVHSSDPDMLFLTGDLGFMALEPLQQALGRRFINAGVAEQNMMSVAAALARQDFRVWVYSIAPFCYARPYEQIRNDITFHRLPVRLVGNGGGYGYGVQGPTHHAIEDYGVLLCLPRMRAFVPVFDEDIAQVVARAAEADHPVYVRLGRGESAKGYAPPAYAPWRQLTHGGGAVVIAVGPLAGLYIDAVEAMPEARRPNLWALAELPLDADGMPPEVRAALERGADLVVAEEHVQRGSFGAELALHLLAAGIKPRRFRHLHARAHQFDRFGSQPYLRHLAGLDADAMLSALAEA